MQMGTGTVVYSEYIIIICDEEIKTLQGNSYATPYTGVLIDNRLKEDSALEEIRRRDMPY